MKTSESIFDPLTSLILIFRQIGMMKLGTLVCLFLAICLPQSEAQLYSRLKQLFPSFDDLENIPSDFQLQDDGLGYVGTSFVP